MAKRRTPEKKAARTIGVESGLVYVVPYSAARSYVRSEIEREGFHRSGCTPIVLFPRSEAGEATREWVERIFAAMDEVRRTHPREALETAGLSPDGAGVDVGIIDIPVTFRGPWELVASNLGRRSAEFFEENLRHVDGLLSGLRPKQIQIDRIRVDNSRHQALTS
jgi:hypothetical protein